MSGRCTAVFQNKGPTSPARQFFAWYSCGRSQPAAPASEHARSASKGLTFSPGIRSFERTVHGSRSNQDTEVPSAPVFPIRTSGVDPTPNRQFEKKTLHQDGNMRKLLQGTRTAAKNNLGTLHLCARFPKTGHAFQATVGRSALAGDAGMLTRWRCGLAPLREVS